jgi:hypothetical protein
MNELENIKTLRIQVPDYQAALMRVLTATIGAWIDDGCDLSTSNIKLMIIDDYDKLDEELKQKEPFLYLYPKRDDIRKPKNGFHKPIDLFQTDYKLWDSEDKKNHVLKGLTKFLFDQSFMDNERNKFDAKHEKPQLHMGDGWFKAFIVEYDTNYYGAFLCISFSNYMTCA